jgi:sugar phosphate isomerase/epimerase
MFALSTSWNALQYSQAKDIIKEINDLGFNQLELNFNLTSTMVDEMVALKERGLVKVVSVHNFCPIPEGVSRQKASPDMFSLSALSEKERKRAVFYTKKTIDTTSRIDAEVAVLHLGKVEIKDRINKLACVYRNKDKQGYIKLKKQMLRERKEKSERFFAQALRSLEELCSYAQRQKVKLGIENRYYFNEIPSFEEMQTLLEDFSSPPLYYWHDVGHAQVYENLELIKHKAFLDRFSQRMIGIHLHDIEGIDDHRAPLKGKFDFTQLLSYITRETIKVLEPHYPATAEDIIQAKKYLENLFETEGA